MGFNIRELPVNTCFRLNLWTITTMTDRGKGGPDAGPGVATIANLEVTRAGATTDP